MDGGTARVFVVSRRAEIPFLDLGCRENDSVVGVKCLYRTKGVTGVSDRLILGGGVNQVAGVVGKPLWLTG